MRNHVPGQSIGRPVARRGGGMVLAVLLGTTVMSGAATTAAWATVAGDDLVDVSGLTQITENEMSELRGGFSLGPWNIDFGLVIKTAINNVQVLQTTFNIPEIGQISDLSFKFLHDNTPPSSGSPAPAQGSSQAAETGGPQPPAAPPVTGTGSPDPSGQVVAAVQNSVPEPPPPTPPQSFDSLNEAIESTAQTGIIPSDAGTSPNATPSPPTGDPGPHPDADGTFTPPPAPLTVAEIANGVVISNGMGTEIVQQVMDGVMTQIVNQANGIEISHTTEMNVFVHNFSQVVSQASARSAFDALAMQAVINNPLLGQ